MVTIVRGHIQGGAVIPDAPLDMPDGLEVELQITTPEPALSNTMPSVEGIESLFGIWRDRKDMSDSEAWVRKQREEWQNRVIRDHD
jgi:hypothetical protein